MLISSTLWTKLVLRRRVPLSLVFVPYSDRLYLSRPLLKHSSICRYTDCSGFILSLYRDHVCRWLKHGPVHSFDYDHSDLTRFSTQLYTSKVNPSAFPLGLAGWKNTDKTFPSSGVGGCCFPREQNTWCFCHASASDCRLSIFSDQCVRCLLLLCARSCTHFLIQTERLVNYDFVRNLQSKSE